VAEEFLDHAQVGATFNKVSGVGVTQRVGMNVTTRDPMIEDSSDVARAKTARAPIQEKCVRRGVDAHHCVARVLDPHSQRLETSSV
jgi:hypothetical protein